MPTNSDNTPATKADLDALEQRLEGRMKQLEEKLIETMGDMQTELLRGFAGHITGLTVRMRKVEAEIGRASCRERV